MRLLALLGLFAAPAFGAPQKEDLPVGATGRLGTQIDPGKLTRPGEVTALLYLGPDSLFVGTTGGWNTWDLQKRRPRQERPVGGPVFAIGRDGEHVFVGSARKIHAIEPVESATAEPVRSWDSVTDSVSVLAVARSGQRLAYVDGDRKLTLLDLKTGKASGTTELPGKPVAATLSANGRILAEVTFGGAVRVGGLSAAGEFTPQWVKRVSWPDRTVIQFSPDGRLVAASSAGRVVIWESVTGRPFASLDRKFGEANVRAIAFSPDGRLLAAASGGPEAVVRIWDVETVQELASYFGHRGDVNAVAFSPDGKTLASGGADQAILFWRVPPTTGEKPMPLADAWEALDSLDARTAYRAIGAMSGDPVRAREVIRTGFRGTADEQKKIRRWIAELDHDEFRVREAARRSLIKAGLRAAAEINDPGRKKLGTEGEERIKQILEAYDQQGVHIPESGLFGEALRMVRAVRVLETIGGRESRAVLEEMAKGPADSPVTKEAKAALEVFPSR
jgi:hypothetical protein